MNEKDKAIAQAMASIQNRLRHVYNQGFENGRKAERKMGKWKPFDLTWGRSVYSCTACGEAMDIPTEMSKPIYRHCPNCGAKMEVDE